MPRLSPVNQARWVRFRHNRRGYWSLWIFARPVCPEHVFGADRQRQTAAGAF